MELEVLLLLLLVLDELLDDDEDEDVVEVLSSSSSSFTAARLAWRPPASCALWACLGGGRRGEPCRGDRPVLASLGDVRLCV